MNNPTSLHPPISPTEIMPANVDGGFLINLGGVIEMAKTGDTPECRRLYRLYCAEYRAREGQPLSHKEREKQAVFAACRRMGITLTMGKLDQ